MLLLEPELPDRVACSACDCWIAVSMAANSAVRVCCSRAILSCIVVIWALICTSVALRSLWIPVSSDRVAFR